MTMKPGSLHDLEVLWEILQGEETDLTKLERLAQWNDTMESLWAHPPSHSDDSKEARSWTPEEAANLSRKCASYLQHRLMHLILSTTTMTTIETNLDDDALQRVASLVATMNDVDLVELSATLRTCKNWLRWHLQIYLSSLSYYPLPDPAHTWKRQPMLHLCLELVERFSVDGEHNELARHATYLIFYGIVCAANDPPARDDDEQLGVGLQLFLEDPTYYARLLRCLAQASSTGLLLGIVKCLHHSLGSSPMAANCVNATTHTLASTTTTQSTKPPWVPPTMTSFRFQSSLVEILRWALFDSEPTFPGPMGDKRSELVTEILDVLYAMRVRCHLDERLSDSLRALFQLSSDRDAIESCQSRALPILMDCLPETLSQSLLAHPLYMDRLFQLFLERVTTVLNDKKIDNAGVVSVTPLLVILMQCSEVNPVFCTHVKELVFPPSEEEHFQTLVQQEKNKREKAGPNMVPLDAPKGTLRWKLAQLMTWPQGQIKRFTGEILWKISGDNAQEFVYRVGMGNALPTLQRKGAVPNTMPGAIQL